MVKNRLKEIRHEMYIDSQIEMAKLLEMNRQQYNRYENNQKPHIELETAFKIAKKLNKTVDEVFYLEEPGD